MLLVKSEEAGAVLDSVADSEGGLVSILARCGIPREFGEQALEADATQHGGAGAAFDGL
jgi:ATP adenylyltransferase